MRRAIRIGGTATVTFKGDHARPRVMKAYGVQIPSGPLTGVTARGVGVLDEKETVLHSDLVPGIGQKPNYHAALAA